jgi:ATP-dependent Lon protease
LHEYVGGHAIFKSELMYDKLPTGVCMGLAWTSLGGSLLYIEGAVVDEQKDNGKLQCTGNLGNVCRQDSLYPSVHSAALGYEGEFSALVFLCQNVSG